MMKKVEEMKAEKDIKLKLQVYENTEQNLV